MNIPNDCLIVKPKEGISPFTHLTWNSNGCPKTIPLDLYELNKERLVIVEDPNNLVPTDKKEPEIINKPESEDVDFEKEVKDVTDAILDGDIVKAGEETKDLIKKVKNVGKGKNKKR